ncbi:MAG TPA: hypothetical protein VIL30_21950 [Ramlibacter sp.]|jgi:hypothetical protein
MFLRVVTGIHRHFDDRVVEWAMAGIGMYWGWTIAQPGQAWTNAAAWAGMVRMADWLGIPAEAAEDSWGIISMLSGGFWLIALTVNGTFADTIYSRISPYVRCAAALGACFVWGQVWMSVSAVQTSGSGIYPLPFVLSIWCVRTTLGTLGDERRKSRAHDRRT